MNLALNDTGAHDAVLANYAAGLLPPPAHALVGTHLEMKADNRSYVSALEDCAAGVMESSEPVALPNRDAILEAIFASSNEANASISSDQPRTSTMPKTLEKFLKTSLHDIPWQSVLPGFKQWDLGEQDGCDVHMFWIKPGRKMPSHTHEGTELFLVIEGSFSDESGTYGPGDFSIADDSVDHRPVAGPECPCIGFSVNDAPLRLTGSLSERIGMFFGR